MEYWPQRRCGGIQPSDVRADAGMIDHGSATAQGTAFVNGQRVAAADLMYAMLDLNMAAAHIDEGQKKALFDWSDRVWRDLRSAR